MKKINMKKTIAWAMAVLTLISALSLFACDKNDNDFGTTLSFAKANSVEEMKKLDGQTVSIVGYMSTLSPISGKFMYLLNLPYQSCPFCEPNSTTLSNTIAVYAKDGKKFEFTDRLIRVEGTLEFGDYTDEYGYNYRYRIKDAAYREVDTSEMGDHLKLWQQLASTNVISDVYAMYDYVNFLCFWGTYTAQFSGGKDYIYADDVKYFLEEEDAQFNYGMKEGYFEDMIARIEAVDKTAFKDLTDNIKKAQELATEAREAFNKGEYEMVDEYSDSFGDGRKQYRMKDYDKYDKRLSEIYREFANWLGEWEV